MAQPKEEGSFQQRKQPVERNRGLKEQRTINNSGMNEHGSVEVSRGNKSEVEERKEKGKQNEGEKQIPIFFFFPW